MPVIPQLEIHSLTYVLPAVCILVTPPAKEKDFIEPGGEHMKAMKSKQRNTGGLWEGLGTGQCTGSGDPEFHKLGDSQNTFW